MGCVVCATRGGEGSRAAQEQAIRYAQENNKELIFMYVVDYRTLDDFDAGLLPAVREELSWLGKILLRVARNRAEMSGVKAQIVLREGDVRQEIGAFLRESGAEVLFLGAPRGTSANVFGDDAIEQFAQAIQERSNVRVEVARPEAV